MAATEAGGVDVAAHSLVDTHLPLWFKPELFVEPEFSPEGYVSDLKRYVSWRRGCTATELGWACLLNCRLASCGGPDRLPSAADLYMDASRDSGRRPTLLQCATAVAVGWWQARERAGCLYMRTHSIHCAGLLMLFC